MNRLGKRVAARGLEPRRLSAQDPKSCVSANFTKRPGKVWFVFAVAATEVERSRAPRAHERFGHITSRWGKSQDLLVAYRRGRYFASVSSVAAALSSALPNPLAPPAAIDWSWCSA